MDSHFANRLVHILEQKGMTQKSLAREAGVTETTISRYIRGERKPRLEIVQKLAVILDVTVDYLVGQDTEQVAQVSDMLKRYRKLLGKTPRQMAHFLRVSPDKYEAYEEGTEGISRAVLRRLNSVFELSAEYLVEPSTNVSLRTLPEDPASRLTDKTISPSVTDEGDLPPEALKELQLFKAFLRQKYNVEKTEVD